MYLQLPCRLSHEELVREPAAFNALVSLLRSSTALKELDLSNSGIGDDGAEAIAEHPLQQRRRHVFTDCGQASHSNPPEAVQPSPCASGSP